MNLEMIEQYINKYNIDINLINGFEIKLSLLLAGIVALIGIITLIRSIIFSSKYSKTKGYNGHVDATFVSADAYDEKKIKHLKRALVRYVVNDNSIVNRMFIPKKQRGAERLIVMYNTKKPSESIIIGDKSTRNKSWRQLIFSAIFIGIAACLYII